MERTRSGRALLLPLSWIYGMIVSIRNACYDHGIFRMTKIGTAVVSVGNLTTGGTGKTPLVEHLAARLLARGAKPAVLSRGYGRNTRGTLVVSDGKAVTETAPRAGDEPVQIARKLQGCPVVVDEKRVRGARFIESAYHPDVIILDDGFQHRALHRDLDIVILDDEQGTAAMPLLPAGNRREQMSALGRAGLVVLNRRDRGEAPGKGEFPATGRTGSVVMSHRLKRFTDAATGKDVPAGELARAGVVAFCGIGNPASFGTTLRENGISPAALVTFPDHHRFTSGDLERIEACRKERGAGYCVTTEKDAVRLGAGTAPGLPPGLVVAEIETVIERGEDLLESALAQLGGDRWA